MGTHPIFESDFDCLTDKNTKNERMRVYSQNGGGGRRPCLSLLIATLIIQIGLCIIAAVLFVLSKQWAQTILCSCCLLMSLATVVGTIKKNYSIISVYLFIQPILLG